jgi:hypothetical protein
MASSSTSKPKLLRKVSTASGAAALKTFEPSVNETWMEALDTASGRLYFVKLEVSASGDAVKPQGDTSWQPPAGFLVRHELVAALSVALDNQNNSSSSGAGGSADDEAAFIEKVKQRFPPPSTPPPSTLAEREAAELRDRVVQLEEEKEMLAHQLEAAQMKAEAAQMAVAATAAQLAANGQQASGAASSSSAPPPMLDQAVQRPSWKRGASSRFGNLGAVPEQPPPPPPWALAKATSGADPYGLSMPSPRMALGRTGGSSLDIGVVVSGDM